MKTRYAFAGILLVLAATTVLAQQRGPKALVVEPRFNMGFMPQHGKVSHTFWVNNVGTDSLYIRSVQVGCGCTKTNNPIGMVPVNDSVPIDVVFDIGTRKRDQNKTVNVNSNDPQTPSLELAFSGYVFEANEAIGPIKITKNEMLNLTNADFGKTVSIEFENRSGAPVMPKAIDWPVELLTVEMPKAEVPHNGKGVMLVKINAAPPLKNYTKSFTIELNDAAKSRYTIPVRMAESLSSAKANVQKGL